MAASEYFWRLVIISELPLGSGLEAVEFYPKNGAIKLEIFTFLCF